MWSTLNHARRRPKHRASLESEISRSYNSFAGSDIKAVIGQFQFAELQAISYSITREKAPIYTMGSADPRSYSRNKRGIAGSIIWINFDRHALLALFNKAKGKFCWQSASQSRFSYSLGPFPTIEIRYRIVGPNRG